MKTECTCLSGSDIHSPTCAISRANRSVIRVPRKEWNAIIRELRDFRSDHADMQGRLAKILGGLSEYGAIEQPLNHSSDPSHGGQEG